MASKGNRASDTSRPANRKHTANQQERRSKGLAEPQETAGAQTLRNPKARRGAQGNVFEFPTEAPGSAGQRSAHPSGAQRSANQSTAQPPAKGGAAPSRRGESQQEAKPRPPFPKQHQSRPGLESRMTPKPKYEAPQYRPSGKLERKIALVTGGDSGIGRAVAVLFAREGADVALVYLPEEQSDAEETQQAIEMEGQRALLLAGDVSDPKFCRDAVERTVDEFGGLDILVNNAAYQQHRENVDQIDEKEFERHFRVNIFGYFYMAKYALQHLQRGGAIINTGSITGLQGNKQLLAYSSTKGAIHAFTKSLAQMLVDRGIRVNCISPGPVWTPLNPADKSAEHVAKHGQDVPMQRPAQPEEIAPAYVFFASEADSSYITGEILTELGGETTAA